VNYAEKARNVKRCRGDEGAILVEFALFAPMLVVLAMGLLEFGLAFKQANTLRTATRAAARAGSNTFAGGGNSSDADLNILLSLKAGVSSIDSDDIVRVVIYRANSSSGDVPATCKGFNPSNGLYGSPGGANCNVYTGDFLAALGTTWNDGYDNGWEPETARDVDSVGGTDFIGVYIATDHALLTGIFGDSLTMTDNTVMRLEPDFNLGG
jgi:hypothetical protein